MLRIALTAAALLLGTAAEAKPYKITMTVDYNSAYMPGTPTSGTMSFQAVINDPLVVTTTSPGQGVSISSPPPRGSPRPSTRRWTESPRRSPSWT
jgi:hypothetical protein